MKRLVANWREARPYPRACFQNTERGRPRPQQRLRNGDFRQFQMARQSQVCCARGRARSNSILKTRPNPFPWDEEVRHH
jgi:hypothetical protein